MNRDVLLKAESLRLHYRSEKGIVRAVDGVDLEIRRGEALVVLGESGCGKTSFTRALLRLLPRNVHDYSGKVLLRVGDRQGPRKGDPVAGSDEPDLTPSSESPSAGEEEASAEMVDVMELGDERFRREVRWNKISMVMQAAMNAMNPVVRVGEQVAEPLRSGLGWPKKKALARAAEVFALVGLPKDFLTRYPFELSGGMRQRAVLAMALVTEPDLVLMDEPTSALDVLTQASILNVLKRIKSELSTSFLLITHDVSTSSELADRVALMYAGQIVEASDARDFYLKPAHPYAHMLMASVPRLHDTTRPKHIPGQPPSLLDLPAGCRFADRCPKRFEKCGEDPPSALHAGGRKIKCWLFHEGGER